MAAAVGALAGIVRYGFFPPAVVTTPMGAGYGAAYGAECVAAAQSHPNAEADFKEIFLAKYPGSLKEGLEMDLNAQREGCPREQAGTALGVAPDAVIEIQEVKFGMGCAFGKQKYWINVKWRALTAMNNRVLGTDVASAPYVPPIARPGILLLNNDIDGDGAVLGNSQDYEETDTTDPVYPTDFKVDVSGIDGTKADVRVAMP